jgi:hypothetical protein
LSRVTYETGVRSGLGLDCYTAILQKMEQIMKHLVAAIGGLEPMIHNNQAKMGTEIKTNQEGMKKEMKAQVGSLASHVNAKQEKMDTNLKEITAEMRAW